MGFNNFLKNLKIDIWYKIFIYLGALLFIFALFVPVYGLTNKQLLVLASSLFFIGIGEWKNHKIAVEFKPPNAYTGPGGILQYLGRKPDLLGTFFVIIGIIFFVLFVINFL